MINQKREHQDFHVGLKAFIAHNDRLLILKHSGGLWELPGGRIEKTETHKDLKDILSREVREELGEGFTYEAGSVFYAWIRESNPLKKNVTLLIGIRCTFRNGHITLSKEHRDFRWITKGEIGTIEFESTYEGAVRYYFESYPH